MSACAKILEIVTRCGVSADICAYHVYVVDFCLFVSGEKVVVQVSLLTWRHFSSIDKLLSLVNAFRKVAA